MSQPLPHSVSAERQVLAWAMLRPDWIGYLTLNSAPDDFYVMQHREVFRRVVDRPVGSFQMGELIDELRAQDALGLVGGVEYLSGLLDDATCQADAERSAARLKQYRRVRRVMLAARKVDEEGNTRATDGADYLDWAEKILFDALHDDADGALEAINISDQCMLTHGLLEAAQNKGDGVTGVATPFFELDTYTGGWQPGQLIVLAARPAMGKSALAGAFAWHAGKEVKQCLFVSLEMSSDDLARRMIAAKAKISTQELSTASIREDSWGRITDAMVKISDATLWLYDRPMLTVEQLVAYARLHRAMHGLDFIVVDYLQILLPGRHQATREREVAQMTARLKALAKELGVPVMLLSQLNRNLEGRADKRPMTADLRDSGSIEQDADIILFLHREAAYDSKAEKTVAEVRIAKHRNGPVGTVRLRWIAEYTRFEEM